MEILALVMRTITYELHVIHIYIIEDGCVTVQEVNLTKDIRLELYNRTTCE